MASYTVGSKYVGGYRTVVYAPTGETVAECALAPHGLQAAEEMALKIADALNAIFNAKMGA